VVGSSYILGSSGREIARATAHARVLAVAAPLTTRPALSANSNAAKSATGPGPGPEIDRQRVLDLSAQAAELLEGRWDTP